VTGELSGEIHGTHLINKIREEVPDIEFSGIGSKRLGDAGVHVIYDYRSISLMGINEVFLKLRHIWTALRRIRKHIREVRPSLVILVDFPGFNMKVARIAKEYGVPVVYFIPPQIWAWHKERIKKIKKSVDKVICILPFEKKYYDEEWIDTTYVGHPFANTAKPTLTKEEFYTRFDIRPGVPVITIMPGSREKEVEKHMPVLIETMGKMNVRLEKMKILLPLAESIDRRKLEALNESKIPVTYLEGLSYDALTYSDVAIIASGSAALEAAMLGTPTIVIYKIPRLSYVLAKLLVKVRFISLPNIVAEREVFPEFIQSLEPEKIAEKALYMLNNGREGVRQDLEDIKSKFVGMDSYDLAKKAIMEFLKGTYGPLP
jgi:lipid-A-disaccharide synthase